MEQVELFCTTVLTTGSGFGVRIDTGEQVFIPSTIIKASNLQEGETAPATVVPNKAYEQQSKTPWFAVRVDRAGQKDAPAPAKTIDDRALEIVRDAEHYVTTAEVAADIGTDTTIAHNALLRLFNQGKLAKADVYASGGQSRPSFCLWAENARDFVGEE